jgi:hypothetical protein
MSEYVAYYESNVGHYMPVVARDTPSGDKDYRELTKEDVARIADPAGTKDAEGIAAGGWLHKKGQGARASWAKRYMIVKGQYLFYFHGTQNDRPVGVIPIENCEINVPPENAKSFSGNRFFRANDGYEFEICHLERRAFQMYASSEHDRAQWVQRLNARTGRVNGTPARDSHTVIRERTSSVTGQIGKLGTSNLDGTSNVSITGTLLQSGGAEASQPLTPGPRPGLGASMADPFAPPPPPVQATGSLGSSVSPSGSNDVSVAALAAISQRTQQLNKPLAFNASAIVPGPVKASDADNSYQNRRPSTASHNSEGTYQSSVAKLEGAIAFSLEKDDEVKQLAKEERERLERDLGDKFRLQQEGRKREAVARER